MSSTPQSDKKEFKKTIELEPTWWQVVCELSDDQEFGDGRYKASIGYATEVGGNLIKDSQTKWFFSHGEALVWIENEIGTL